MATHAQATATAAAVSAAAFQESARFANELGVVREKFRSFTAGNRDPISILEPPLTDILAHAERHIAVWHAYLNVPVLHSEGCMRAAFATVTANKDLFSTLCSLGEKLHERCAVYWNQEAQNGLTRVLERLEDIQDNLAVLLDDNARTELQSILTEAGIDGRMLERKDAEGSSRTTRD
jgi:hypothetical protein